MNIRISPSLAKGSVTAPPSKSMAHRALICAALAKGESRIAGISDCEDVSATLDCLSALGAECRFDNDTVVIQGVDFSKSVGALIPCRESGSTMRFMLPLCLLSGNSHTLTGAPSLLRRPMTVYQDLCHNHGLYFSHDANGIIVKGPLTAGEYTLPGDVSSQFISGMLFALTQVKGAAQQVVQGNMPGFISYGLNTLATAGTMAVGILIITTILRFWHRFHQN